MDAGWLFLIPLVPLCGAIVNAAFGARLQRRFGRHAVSVVAVGVVVAAMGLGIGAVAQLAALPARDPALGRVLVDRVFTMVDVGGLRVDFTLALDALSAVLVLVITVVGALIHVYAVGYMADEPAYWRFFACLSLFVFAMLVLVLGDGFVPLLVGWEGVGVCSYLLIGFWYAEPKNARAGMKAFVVNRVGDWGLFAGVALLFWAVAGSWSAIDHRYYFDVGHVQPTLSFRALEQLFGAPEFAHAFAAKTIFGAPVPLVVSLLLLFGACGKSAQAPLHVWLPDAMAGPTPVSALIHAATMVTAGVYLIARLRFLFVLSPAALDVVVAVGLVTALGGAMLGMFQYDIKRVLAYSTISQLGFMFVALGVGAWGAALFHLVTHACFKACLFLGSGSVIAGMHRLTHARHTGHLDEGVESETDRHAMAAGDDEHQPAQLDPRVEADPTDPQDMRNMGGLGELMPRTRWSYLVACWAIAGFPWAAGFWSKDQILAAAYGKSMALWLVGVATAGMTAFYMFRSYYLTFEARPATAAHRRHVRESPAVMTSVLTILAVASLVVGPLGAWLLAHVTGDFAAHEAAARVTAGLMLASVAMATLGWAAARAFYKDEAEHAKLRAANRLRYENLHAFAFDNFRIDELYEATFVRGFAACARAAAWLDEVVVDGVVHALAAVTRGAAWLTGAIDRLFVDGAVDGVAALVLGGGRAARRVQTGRVSHYVLGMTMGVVLLVVWASWW
ncbi:MAG TPA: NADH-quinone oxidoreductase subunit L [Polyangia bacterium]|nr:NADH-quinone oxidoreductase subunit L [Polyangia bacterium]